jgi:polyhydroxybutyrate depolymerase
MLTQFVCLALIAPAPITKTYSIDGEQRSAVIYPGSKAASEPSPVVFVFHGHGGNSRQAARAYALHEAWPEADVVYPQGLPTYSSRTRRTGPGWQLAPGQDGGRDLKFVDALIKDLRANFHGDPKRTYACGMSNGAAFTFVLLYSRPTEFAAFAEVAGAGGLLARLAKTPKPYLLVHGKSDPLVSASLAEASRDRLIALNGCAKDSKEWATGWQLFPGKDSNDVIWRLHDGGHAWPEGVTQNIVRFFKSH